MKNIDMTTTSGCIQFLLDRRFTCRILLKRIDSFNADRRRNRRCARMLRETKSPFDARRAEILEGKAKFYADLVQEGLDFLRTQGCDLIRYAKHVDKAIPQSLLLDLMNVNRADRHSISSDDGIVEIVFVRGLEDSAMHRGSDWKQGPLAQAVFTAMIHELNHNERLAQAAHDDLFGKGGMLEFLPTYRETAEGGYVRMPPKLRAADTCDVKHDA